MSTAKTCRHIMPTGRTCKSPAMRGAAYCYYHGPEKSPRRVSGATEQELEIVPLADPADITFTAAQILRALASNQISKGRAAVMFQGLQTIMASYRIPYPEFDPATDFAPNPNPNLAPSFAHNLDPDLDPIPAIESLLRNFNVPRPTGHAAAK